MSNSDLKAKVAEIIDSKSKVELITDIIFALDEKSNASKLRCIHALNKAWTHMIRRGDLNLNKDCDKSQTWIRSAFEQSCDRLIAHISVEDKRVTNLALSTVVGFVVTIHETNNEGKSNINF